jgi:hypothetical protein
MDHEFIPPPPRADRATATQLLDTIELWPLDWWAVNGRDVIDTAERIRAALAKLAAPVPQNLRQTADAV